MNNYTLEQLSQAETYTNDPELATWVRKICATTHTDDVPMPFGAWKREYLAGKHAEHVYQELQILLVANKAAEDERVNALFTRNAKIRQALSILTLPPGIEFAGNSESHLFIKAPWDGSDLAERLGRIGGEWNRQKKYFEIPLESATSLQRIFNNWRKAQDQREAIAAEQKRQQEAAQAKARAERQAQWDKERAEQQATYAAQRQAQAKAVAERVRIQAGQYKIGDILEGKPITGFGKQWSVSTLAGGPLWQECDYGRCENEPVCVHCEKCENHCDCQPQITYCYAYFS